MGDDPPSGPLKRIDEAERMGLAAFEKAMAKNSRTYEEYGKRLN